MGVTGLWHIVQPCARPIKLETLNRKRLAVDASIWIYQFLKAVRDKEGHALRNSHIVGFFRRICKLLFFGIKPVFVFDGGAPALKRQTIVNRKKRREGRREDAVRTAGKLLAVQMQRIAEEDADRRRKEAEGINDVVDDDEPPLPRPEDMVYESELGMTKQQRLQNRKFVKKDAYHLPDLNGSIAEMGRPEDPRIMSVEELEEYAQQFHNGEDINLYDFSKIDFDGDFFQGLPLVDQYNILNAARLRSRLRMGLSKEQLEKMFPDRMEFSRFQIERVRERNNLTQRLMRLVGFDTDSTIGLQNQGRIAGERNREYVLIKNEGVEGGWALGVISTDKTVGERSKPIDVDALHQKVEQAKEDEEEEDDFEDVPIEGLNRLPKIRQNQRPTQNNDATTGMTEQRRQFYASRQADARPPDRVVPEENSLFVGSDPLFEESGDREEDDDLQRAIAMSLETQHGVRANSEDEAEFEDIPMPEFVQSAVKEQRPIVASSGQAIAHIVNNRSNAAVPARKDESSDDELDFSKALAASRRKATEKKTRAPAPAQPNVKNPFDGPLPFESLSFKTSLFGKKKEKTIPSKDGGDTAESDHGDEEQLQGGFVKDKEEEKPRPLPPWLAGSEDIRSSVQQQHEKDLELNAKDREQALEEERAYQREHGVITLDSSDNESDIEFVDVQPRKQTIDLTEDKEIDSAKEIDLRQSLQKDPSPAKAVTPFEELSTASPLKENPSQADKIQEGESSQAQSQEEFIEWSESDRETSTKPVDAATVEPEVVIPQESPSPEPDFEDVAIPDHINETVQLPDSIVQQEAKAKSPSPVFEDVGMTDSLPPTSEPAAAVQDSVFSNEDFDDFSDPEDEELLAQLAIEAEEHARFASTLNNKTAQENQLDYERELKTLRNQQKKDRRDADEVTHVMVTECQALLRLFGLPYITAPMEAEAQCSELVRLGLVDGIVTDDSDIFLFGGTRVYKNMFNSNKYVECYLDSDLEKELELSRSQLISVAHLLGSDYTEGLPGIGPVTAMEIVSEFPGETGLEEFKEWWQDVQQNMRPKEADAGSPFRRKFRRSQAKKLFLPPGFPSPAVSQAYMEPDVDHSAEEFQWGVPDLDNLRTFLMSTIGWSQERTDEVLVPVIKDMNRRAAEGTQSNITRFISGPTAVGTGARDSFAPRNRGPANSTRMVAAVNKLKSKGKSKLSKTFADEAAEWASKNELGNRPGQVKSTSKRRASSGPASVDVDDHDGDAEEAIDGTEGDSGSARKAGKKTTGRKKTKV